MKRSGFYPDYRNKAQEIYHSIDRKHENRKEEFVRILKQEFVRMCVEDGVVDDAKEIMKPPSYIRYC